MQIRNRSVPLADNAQASMVISDRVMTNIFYRPNYRLSTCAQLGLRPAFYPIHLIRLILQSRLFTPTDAKKQRVMSPAQINLLILLLEF